MKKCIIIFSIFLLNPIINGVNKSSSFSFIETNTFVPLSQNDNIDGIRSTNDDIVEEPNYHIGNLELNENVGGELSYLNPYCFYKFTSNEKQITRLNLYHNFVYNRGVTCDVYKKLGNNDYYMHLFSYDSSTDDNSSDFPEVPYFPGETFLYRLRDKILIDMEFDRHTTQHHEDVYVQYDIQKYKDAIRTRWNPYTNEPIEQPSSLCYVLRRIVNEDESRQAALLEILEDHPKAIIFYNFDNELDILLNLAYQEGTEVAQYNGHIHEPVPKTDRWVYLVNYNACEAWNNTTTNCMIFFSQNYSYKIMLQAAGRIDRMNTKFTDLYYYHLKSRSGIDLAISKALKHKKKFNERKFAKWD